MKGKIWRDKPSRCSGNEHSLWEAMVDSSPKIVSRPEDGIETSLSIMHVRECLSQYKESTLTSLRPEEDDPRGAKQSADESARYEMEGSDPMQVVMEVWWKAENSALMVVRRVPDVLGCPST